MVSYLALHGKLKKEDTVLLHTSFTSYVEIHVADVDTLNAVIWWCDDDAVQKLQSNKAHTLLPIIRHNKLVQFNIKHLFNYLQLHIIKSITNLHLCILANSQNKRFSTSSTLKHMTLLTSTWWEPGNIDFLQMHLPKPFNAVQVYESSEATNRLKPYEANNICDIMQRGVLCIYNVYNLIYLNL